MMEMTREMAIGKIHRAVVTGADLNYVGSITRITASPTSECPRRSSPASTS